MDSNEGGWRRWRGRLVLTAFLAMIAFYLVTEHTAHTYDLLPYALLLMCLFLHFFMHGGHGRQHSNLASHEHSHDRKEGS
jgi:hypothetical protein